MRGRPPRTQRQLALEASASRVGHGELDPGRARGHFGINLDFLDPYRWQDLQFDAAHDAVPVALGMIADAVGIFANVYYAAVIDLDGQRVGAGL